VARTTHHRAYDHHGAEDENSIELLENLAGFYPPGTSLKLILSDLVMRLVAIEQMNGLYVLTVGAILKAPRTGSFTIQGVQQEEQELSLSIDAVIA